MKNEVNLANRCTSKVGDHRQGRKAKQSISRGREKKKVISLREKKYSPSGTYIVI